MATPNKREKLPADVFGLPEKRALPLPVKSSGKEFGAHRARRAKSRQALTKEMMTKGGHY